jgi:hypothetical protein
MKPWDGNGADDLTQRPASTWPSLRESCGCTECRSHTARNSVTQLTWRWTHGRSNNSNKSKILLDDCSVNNDKIGWTWSRVQRSQAIQFTLPHLPPPDLHSNAPQNVPLLTVTFILIFLRRICLYLVRVCSRWSPHAPSSFGVPPCGVFTLATELDTMHGHREDSFNPSRCYTPRCIIKKHWFLCSMFVCLFVCLFVC